MPIAEPARHRPRDAFTLIELVVVIVIMAVLATLASFSLSGTMDRYQLSRACDVIQSFDARARRGSRRLGQPLDATIQRSRRRLIVSGPHANRSEFHLPSSVEIKQIRMRRRIVASRDFEIRFNRDGVCPTYAVQLQRGNIQRWLVVLGVSGQVIDLQDTGEVDEFLSL